MIAAAGGIDAGVRARASKGSGRSPPKRSCAPPECSSCRRPGSQSVGGVDGPAAVAGSRADPRRAGTGACRSTTTCSCSASGRDRVGAAAAHARAAPGDPLAAGRGRRTPRDGGRAGPARPARRAARRAARAPGCGLLARRRRRRGARSRRATRSRSLHHLGVDTGAAVDPQDDAILWVIRLPRVAAGRARRRGSRRRRRSAAGRLPEPAGRPGPDRRLERRVARRRRRDRVRAERSRAGRPAAVPPSSAASSPRSPSTGSPATRAGRRR